MRVSTASASSNVLAHEVGEVADRLHRHGLMEQVERLLGLDAEPATERAAVGREGVEDFNALHHPQPFLERVDVGAEIREVLGNRKRHIGDDEEACRLSLQVLEPEHLCECDVLVEPRIAELAENDRIGIVVAQRHGLRRIRAFGTLRFVVPQYIGPQIALARLCAGRLVVGDLLGRHEQRGDRVHHCGLA